METTENIEEKTSAELVKLRKKLFHLTEQKRKEEWLDNWPNGQFKLAIEEPRSYRGETDYTYSLIWQARRFGRCLVVTRTPPYKGGPYHGQKSDEYVLTFKENGYFSKPRYGWGAHKKPDSKRTFRQRKDLESLVKLAKTLDFPPEMIALFTQKYEVIAAAKQKEANAQS